METAIKPQKRNKNLLPLSREHHFGLLFCWKLKQGLANGTSLEILRAYTLYFWENDLRGHFDKEEHFLLNILPETHLLQQQMLREHHLIRDLVGQVEENGLHTGLLFEALHTLVSDHIRFEERQYFPILEQQATPDQLAVIGSLLLEETGEPIDDFTPAFWLTPKKQVFIRPPKTTS